MTYTYCPECRAPLRQYSTTKYVCEQGHELWNNPKATVTIIFLQDNQALFSERRIEPRKGAYDFPGGFVEYGEQVFDAAVREIREECNVTIQPEDLHYITSNTHEYTAGTTVADSVFAILRWQGDFSSHDDVASLAWKPLSFMDDPRFAWPYRDLRPKLEYFIHNSSPTASTDTVQ